MTHREILQKAQESRSLVRLRRSNLEGGWVDGYVVGLGRVFVALEIVDASIRLDGFECFRITDLTEVDLPAPTAAFQERALGVRGLERRPQPELGLDSVADLLHTASLWFPVVTLHVEERDPEVCYIGRVLEVREEEVEIHEISIHGRWAERALFDLDAITRVDFGGAYEEALLMVAGEPRPEPRPKGPRPMPRD